MNDYQSTTARACLAGSKSDTIPFPEAVARLMEAGFERYAVDFCRDTHTFYLPNGDSLVLDAEHGRLPIGAGFDVSAIRLAIREAQLQPPGYRYEAFCEKVTRAGCVGYTVSFAGSRAVYYARTAEAHVEHFPD